MKRNATVIFDIQPIELPRKIARLIMLDLNPATSAGARLRHRSRRAHLFGVRVVTLIAELRQRLFQLCNSRFELFGIRQGRRPGWY